MCLLKCLPVSPHTCFLLMVPVFGNEALRVLLGVVSDGGGLIQELVLYSEFLLLVAPPHGLNYNNKLSQVLMDH